MIAAIHFFMATIWTGHPSLGGGRFKPCKINSSFEYGWLKETKVPAFVRPKLMAQSLGGEHGVVIIKTIIKVFFFFFGRQFHQGLGVIGEDSTSALGGIYRPGHSEIFYFFGGLFHGGPKKWGMFFLDWNEYGWVGGARKVTLMFFCL